MTDNEGYPITGLAIDDFEVIEDGETQPLVHIDSAEKPFNLVLLLDASSSTEGDRDDIEEAARRFIGIARENDKIAVYTLADTLFQVLSRLTTDHELARDSVGLIATFGGATPLYDIIVLSYAHELAKLRRERNAIVILSDGIDNTLYKWGVGPGFQKMPAKAVERRRDAITPSKVSFEQVRKAAQEMDAMIYPVLLDSAVSAARNQPARYENVRRWSLTAHGQARELAEASGGRVFAARSVRDLEGVYEQVARDLRSIYTLNYRPTNQDLDGKWRRVRVKVAKARSTVRSRPGYYAY